MKKIIKPYNPDNNCREYYNLEKVLSHNYFVNMILSARGIGKTYTVKDHCFSRWYKKEHRFLYLRRNDKELTNGLEKETFINEEIFRNNYKYFKITNKKLVRGGYKFNFEHLNGSSECKMDSRYLVIDDNIVCYLKAASTFFNSNSNEFPNINNIFFEEFLIQPYMVNKRYHPMEVDNFAQILSTVFRKRPGNKVIMTGNSGSQNNPYFLTLGLDCDNSKRFWKYPEIATIVEFPPHMPMYGEDKEGGSDNENPLFKFIKGLKTSDSTFHNEFTEKTLGEIKNIKSYKSYLFSIVTRNNSFTVFSLNGSVGGKGIFYVDEGFDTTSKKIYTYEEQLIGENYIYIEKTHIIAKWIKNRYYSNQLIYSNSLTRINFQEIIEVFK